MEKVDYKTLYCMDHNKLENSERDGNSRAPVKMNNSSCFLIFMQKTFQHTHKAEIKPVFSSGEPNRESLALGSLRLWAEFIFLLPYH